MICPCKACTERTSTCHADCNKYAEWDIWKKEVNRKKSLDQEVSSKLYASALRMMKENFRRRRR